MPGQVMPDIDALDSALYTSQQNSGIVVTGPSFPYSSFSREKFTGYDLSMKAYQDEPYIPLELISPFLNIDKMESYNLEIIACVNNEYFDQEYLNLIIDKKFKERNIICYVHPEEDDNREHVFFEIEKKQNYVHKDTILGTHIFDSEQEFEEFYTDIRDTSEYQYAYFDDFYYYFLSNSTSNVEGIDEEDLTIIQEFTKLKPKVYSPPRVLTDLIGYMESIDFDVLSYDYMSSPILYTGITPFVQVGTRLNKVIYPKTTMRTRGLATRRVCS